MAAIGELFKYLGKNQKFSTYCNELQNNKKTEEIINLAFQDEQLLSELKNIINDESIIKNKMEVIIGQKRKSLESKKQKDEKEQKEEIKKNEKVNSKNDEQDDDEQDDEQEDDEQDDDEQEDEYIFKFKPFNEEKVTWLHKYSFVEPVDHLMRLVNYDMELYY